MSNLAQTLSLVAGWLDDDGPDDDVMEAIGHAVVEAERLESIVDSLPKCWRLVGGKHADDPLPTIAAANGEAARYEMLYCFAVDAITELNVEVKRLQKTSLALPDGTPIAPGVEVVCWSYGKPRHLLRHTIDRIEWNPIGVWLTFVAGTVGRSIEECYGTKQTAQAAGGE